MRWSIARILFLTAAVALGLATYSQARSANTELQWRAILGAYLAVIVTTTAVAFSSPPRFRRFCFTYSLFGWSYFVFVMRLGLLFRQPWPVDVQTNFIPTTVLGILMGFACAFASLVLPGPVEPTVNSNDKHYDQ